MRVIEMDGVIVSQPAPEQVSAMSEPQLREGLAAAARWQTGLVLKDLRARRDLAVDAAEETALDAEIAAAKSWYQDTVAALEGMGRSQLLGADLSVGQAI